MKRKRLEIGGDTMSVLVQMSDGNPGAVRVLVDVLQHVGDLGLIRILDLDDMNMRGPMIWIGYKDFCGQDIAKYCEKIASRDPEMVSFINEHRGHEGTFKAVTHGGSFDHT